MTTAITLTQMHMVAAAEADRIDMSETVWRTREGLPPDPGQIRKMKTFQAITRLIDRIYADPVVLERLRNPPKPGAAT